MIGGLNRERREVTIVGGGISGMLSAYYLDRAGFEVRLFEASARLGGLISTARTEWGISESAVHSFPASSTMRALCEDLGVPLVAVRDDSKARFIVRRGEARRFPMVLSAREYFQAFLRAYFILADSRTALEDVSIEAWAKRHVGKTAYRYLVDPMISGIYGASPNELSIAAAFPRFSVPHGHSLLSRVLARRVREPRRDRKEKKPISAPRDGMQSLVEALEKRLRERLGSRLKTGVRVGELPDAPNVILCVPAPALVELLGAADPALAAKLKAVSYSPLISATAFLDRSGFATEPKGLGVLMPACEERACLGILFNSSAFPNRVQDDAKTVSVTGFFSETQVGANPSEGELRERLIGEMKSLFGYSSGEAKLVIHRWPLAIPRYDRALLDSWALARGGWCAKPGHVLFGNLAGQVALRSMAEDAQTLSAGG